MMNLVTKLLGRIAEQRRIILVVGDAMTDVWVHGRVEECQDGCPKFVEESRCTVPGGADNAARSVSNWDVTTLLYALLDGERVAKVRFVDGDGKIVFRHDDDIEANPILIQNRLHEYRFVMDEALRSVDDASAVLLSDYDKGFLTPEFIRQVAAKCDKRGIPCVADCKRAPEVYAGCILKGNAAWFDKYGPPNVQTGGSGSPLVNGEFVDLLTGSDWPLVRCVNHVGAGDCFAAHLTLALAYGFSLREAAALAHSAGRVYVQHSHNRPPYPHEIVADMESIQ